LRGISEEPPESYDYKKAREYHGYIDKKPKYVMFRLGWKSYGSVGWNTYQSAVDDAIREFGDRGYQID
jgi:hypothetical protein